MWLVPVGIRAVMRLVVGGREIRIIGRLKYGNHRGILLTFEELKVDHGTNTCSLCHERYSGLGCSIAL